MITLVDLKAVLGRRLVRRLLEAKLIVPSAYDARGDIRSSTLRPYIARSERLLARSG